ncbi:plasmid SOS inhibition protein A (plasmid) [Escherichia coli PMV-1]|nr:plasmid SOS inhibition protein A [Escherichia coli PMV-1]
MAEHDRTPVLAWERSSLAEWNAGMAGYAILEVIAEASLAAREAGHAVREMERWMVPNKLREAA